VSRIEGNGKRSLRRPKLSTIKGSSAPGRRRRRYMPFKDQNRSAQKLF
jgi:hypothetical protein